MTAVFEHILVPVDFTTKNTRAINLARELAVQNQARITLLHVIETISYTDDDAVKGFYETLEKKADNEFDRLLRPLRDVGLDVQQDLIYGRRGPEIVRYALEQDADLIVLSSHSISPQDRERGWATLSYQVSIFCQCPALLVK